MRRFSSEQRTGLFGQSNRALDGNLFYGLLLRDPEKRAEVNRWIADAIEHEAQYYAGFNPKSEGRQPLQNAVYRRVSSANEKYGLVFEFVLMAVLSWLIGKWLDYIFSNDAYPE